MGTSLRVTVKPEGVEATQAAIQGIARSTAQAAKNAAAEAGRHASDHATNLEHRYAHASLKVTEAMSRVAESGNIAGNGMAKVIEIGANMAFMFGTTGPIVGAFGIATLAIVRMFKGAREEMEKTIKQGKESVDELINSGNNVAQMTKLRDLQYGTAAERRRNLLENNVELGGIAYSDSVISGLRAQQNPFNAGWIRKQIAAEMEKSKALREMAKDLENAIRNPGAPLGGVGGLAASRVVYDATPKDDKYIPPDEDPAGGNLARFIARNMLQIDKDNEWKKLDPKVMADMIKSMTPDVVQIMKDSFGPEFQEGLRQSIEESFNTPFMKKLKLKNQLATGIKDAVAGGITTGLMAALASGDLSKGFQALGNFLMQQLSTVLVNVALEMISFAQMMADFQTFLVSNPWVAVAVAVGMLALAKSFGGAGGGGGGGGYAGGGGYSGGAVAAAEGSRIVFGSGSTSTAAGMAPRAANNFTVIGPNDPTAQRTILELIAKAERRG